MTTGEGAECILSLLPGDVHVGMADRNGQLEVEVIQARGLIPKMGSKSIPGRWLGTEWVWDGGGVMGMGSMLGPHRSLLPAGVSHLFPNAATYVKVYLLENGICLAKKKTKVVKKTCDPSYQQPLLFEESPQGKVLQVMNSPLTALWGQGGIMGARAGRRNPASSLLSFSLPAPIKASPFYLDMPSLPSFPQNPHPLSRAAPPTPSLPLR